jgi:hypothetical protein
MQVPMAVDKTEMDYALSGTVFSSNPSSIYLCGKGPFDFIGSFNFRSLTVPFALP